MTDSSNSSRGEGIQVLPPVQGSPAKRWTLRWSNYPDNWKDIIVPEFQSHECKGYMLGEELCPTTGTPHIQGYAEFKEKIRWSCFKALPKGIEWQAAKGNLKSNVKYCSKDQKFISMGTCKMKEPYKVEITFYPWEEEAVSVLNTKPNDRDIHWYWEAKGCAGKTTFQKWVFTNYEGVVVLSGKASDMKNGVLKYIEDKEEYPKIVLINIPRAQNPNHLSWTGVEEIKDMFFFSPKYEGGMVCGPNPHVLLFSNEEPPMDKLSKDRWIEHHIG